MQQDKESNPIKRMAELLRQGATLTDLSCPVCASPLFRLRDGTLWCAKDEKKVVVVKEGEEPPKQAPQPNTAYDKLEAVLMAKIADIQGKIEKTEDIDELQKLTLALSELLNSVEKIKKMKAWATDLTLGFYETFPESIHHLANYQVFVSTRQLQEKLLQFIGDINRKELAFEQISIPTVPHGIVILEFGLAEEGGFNYLNEEEVKRARELVENGHIGTLDFFCSIRYYKGNGDKHTALKFDYYMLRALFGKGTLEMRVFHERGPRYLSPEDLTGFIFTGINGESTRKILRETNQ